MRLNSLRKEEDSFYVIKWQTLGRPFFVWRNGVEESLKKEDKKIEINLSTLLFYLNSLKYQEIASFLKSSTFTKIQENSLLLKQFSHDVIFKEKEMILKIMDDYTKNLSQKRSHYDECWKKVLPLIIQDMICYSSPSLYEAIDWGQGIEDGKEELDALFYLSVARDRVADAIFKVILKQPVDENTICTTSFGSMVCVGNKAYIILHIEVQNKKTPDFGSRMFQMQYRLIDRYQAPLYSLALTSFRAKKVEDFSYKIAETKIGCEFRCINLLYFETKKGKKELAQMKAQQKLLPFIMEAHLFLFRADKKEKEDILLENMRNQLEALFHEFGSCGLTQKEETAFFQYIGGLLQVKKLTPLGEDSFMPGTQSSKSEPYFAQEVADLLYGEYKLLQKVWAAEAEAKEAKESEAKVKAEAEVKAKEAEVKAKEAEVKAKEVEAKAKEADAKATYDYCFLKGFVPQEKISKEEFVVQMISLSAEQITQVATFTRDQARSLDEVFAFIRKLPQ